MPHVSRTPNAGKADSADQFLDAGKRDHRHGSPMRPEFSESSGAPPSEDGRSRSAGYPLGVHPSHSSLEAALAELSDGLSEREVVLLIDTCRPYLWTGAISDLRDDINHGAIQVWGTRWRAHYPNLQRLVGRFSPFHAQALLHAAERFWVEGGRNPSRSIADMLRAIGLLRE